MLSVHASDYKCAKAVRVTANRWPWRIERSKYTYSFCASTLLSSKDVALGGISTYHCAMLPPLPCNHRRLGAPLPCLANSKQSQTSACTLAPKSRNGHRCIVKPTFQPSGPPRGNPDTAALLPKDRTGSLSWRQDSGNFPSRALHVKLQIRNVI